MRALKELVAWLERAGCDEIYLIDNDSRYEPLRDYLKGLPHRVIQLDRNYGHNALWHAPGIFELTRGRRFVYTDPDIIPDETCPPDAISRFSELLDRWRLNKAGFGLRIDDIPDHYRYKPEVLVSERGNWEWPLAKGVYFAPIDTRFAVYREGSGPRPHDGIRTGPPYVAHHDSWYLDLDNLADDDLFYAQRIAAEPWDGQVFHWADAAPTEAMWTAQASVGRAYRAGPVRRRVTQLRWWLYGRRALRADTTSD